MNLFKKFNLEDKIVVSAKQKAHKLVYEESANETMETFIKNIQGIAWPIDEINFAFDAEKFNTMDHNSQEVLVDILSFFAIAEAAVIENLVDSLEHVLQCENAGMFISSQLTAEKIHAATYSKQFKMIDPQRFYSRMSELEELDAVKRKYNWMTENLKVGTPAMNLVLATVFAEGILFQTSFAMIRKLSTNVRMEGLQCANELISRDESLHCDFYAFIFNEMRKSCVDVHLFEETARKIFEGAIDVELQFIKRLFRFGKFYDLEESEMISQLNHMADGLWKRCGFKSDKVTALAPHMNVFTAPIQVNFFEQRATTYVHGAVIDRAEFKDYLSKL